MNLHRVTLSANLVNRPSQSKYGTSCSSGRWSNLWGLVVNPSFVSRLGSFWTVLIKDEAGSCDAASALRLIVCWVVIASFLRLVPPPDDSVNLFQAA
jgi:hypothetical protein